MLEKQHFFSVAMCSFNDIYSFSFGRSGTSVRHGRAFSTLVLTLPTSQLVQEAAVCMEAIKYNS